MKNTLLTTVFFLVVGNLFAQKSKLFAVTDADPAGTTWTSFRAINAETPQTDVLLSNKAYYDRHLGQSSLNTISKTPMQAGVAAIAFDRQQNRMYYVTMMTGELRFFTPNNSGSVDYNFAASIFDKVQFSTKAPIGPQHQEPVITRLAMSPNGFVYGLSNDGNIFFRYGGNGQERFEMLGGLNDEKNNAISVHASNTSWGGDMIADANGNLYLFSLNRQVFSINPTTRMATHLGALQGLPDGFTINGAAVQEDGSVLLSSAAGIEGYAVMENINDLTAKLVQMPGWFKTSDLASAYFLNEKKQTSLLNESNEMHPLNVTAFPNPVTNGSIQLRFDANCPDGKYFVELLNNQGSRQAQAVFMLKGSNKQVAIPANNLTKGMYLVKVNHDNKQANRTLKVIVQ